MFSHSLHQIHSLITIKDPKTYGVVIGRCQDEVMIQPQQNRLDSFGVTIAVEPKFSTGADLEQFYASIVESNRQSITERIQAQG